MLNACLCHLVVSDSLWRFGLYPTRLFYPCNFSGKNTGEGCHFLLLGIFQTQGSNSYLLHLLHWQADSLPAEPSELPWIFRVCLYSGEKGEYKFKAMFVLLWPGASSYSTKVQAFQWPFSQKDLVCFPDELYLLQQDWFLWPLSLFAKKKQQKKTKNSFLSLKFCFIPRVKMSQN